MVVLMVISKLVVGGVGSDEESASSQMLMALEVAVILMAAARVGETGTVMATAVGLTVNYNFSKIPYCGSSPST